MPSTSSSSRRFKRKGRKSKTPTGTASRKKAKLISSSGLTQQPPRSTAATASKQQQHSPQGANSSPGEPTQETLNVSRPLNIQLGPQLVGPYEPSLAEQHPPAHSTATGNEDTEPAPEQLPAPADGACCPVCSAKLCSISDTDAGRTAHVNACLDAAAGGPAVSHGGYHNPAFEHVDMTEGQNDQNDEQQDDEHDSMHTWYVDVQQHTHVAIIAALHQWLSARRQSCNTCTLPAGCWALVLPRWLQCSGMLRLTSVSFHTSTITTCR